MYFQLLKKHFFAILSLENIILDIEPKLMSQTSRKKFGVNPNMIRYDFV